MIEELCVKLEKVRDADRESLSGQLMYVNRDVEVHN